MFYFGNLSNTLSITSCFEILCLRVAKGVKFSGDTFSSTFALGKTREAYCAQHEYIRGPMHKTVLASLGFHLSDSYYNLRFTYLVSFSTTWVIQQSPIHVFIKKTSICSQEKINSNQQIIKYHPGTFNSYVLNIGIAWTIVVVIGKQLRLHILDVPIYLRTVLVTEIEEINAITSEKLQLKYNLINFFC